MVDVLREEGHYVEAVLDSPEGLTRISRNHYDLVICDLRMPRLDGPAFYDALVRAGSPMRNRILFTTGDTLAPRTLDFVEPKGLPFLAKPFLVEELKLAVNGLLVGAETRPRSRARTKTGRPQQKETKDKLMSAADAATKAAILSEPSLTAGFRRRRNRAAIGK